MHHRGGPRSARFPDDHRGPKASRGTSRPPRTASARRMLMHDEIKMISGLLGDFDQALMVGIGSIDKHNQKLWCWDGENGAHTHTHTDAHPDQPPSEIDHDHHAYSEGPSAGLLLVAGPCLLEFTPPARTVLDALSLAVYA